MPQRVLVPLDESALAEHVLPHVITVTGAAGHAAAAEAPHITLLRVLEPPTSAGVEVPTDPVEWQLALDGATTYLEGVKRRLAEVGVDARCVVEEGDPATTVLQHVRDEHIDLLALTSHGRGGMLGHSLGNVTSKVVMRAQCSVLLARALHGVDAAQLGTSVDYHTVIAPLDGSLRAEASLALAARICERTSAKLVLAHVVDDDTPLRRRLPDEEEDAAREAFRGSERAAAATYLARLAADLGANGLTVEQAVIGDGDVAAAIDRLVEERHPDLTVLSAHGESGGTAWPLGSTALHLIVYGATTLLVVQDRRRGELRETHSERAARERQGHG